MMGNRAGAMGSTYGRVSGGAVNCLICNRHIPDHERDYCATRKTDGGLVCPECLANVRAGNADALDKLHDSKVVRT